MALISETKRAELPALVAALEQPDHVSEPLLALVQRIDAEHGTRWLTVADVGKSVHEDFPEHAAAYDAYAEKIDTPRQAFTFIWAGYHVLLMYRAASLAFPGLDFIPMGQAWTEAGLDKFFENPAYLMMRKAIGNDVGDLIEVMFRENPLFNYGTQTVHRDGPRRYTCYGTDTYVDWVEILLVPFARGMFEQFDVVGGTAAFERLSDHSFEIVFEW